MGVFAEKNRVTAEIILRPGNREDFLNSDGFAKYGVCFWLRSSINGKWQNSPQIFDRTYMEPDKAADMKLWLSKGMVFIPVHWVDI